MKRTLIYTVSVIATLLLLLGIFFVVDALAPNPILLVVNDSAPNVFGRYYGEILRAEGLNSYDVATVGAVTAASMAQYRVVILAETPLTAGQAAEFTAYVGAGGYLIAMRPDSQISGLFGLGANQGTQTDGYLGLNGSGPSAGLPTATLQIHGTVDEYTPAGGAVTLVQLYSDATTSTPYPAVIQDATGHGTAFNFDLATNIILMRQGNPANADVDSDGDKVLRTIDLFQNPTWVDLNKVPIPQADIQQRFFARLILQAINANQPTPQMWYFPDTNKTMLILTGDAHANPPAWYQQLIDILNAHNAKMTFYLSIGGGLTDADVQAWRAEGHEFGIHPYAFKPDPYPPQNITNLSEGFDVYTSWFPMVFSSPMSPTVRSHQLAWKGWTTAADYAVAHGLEMDTNFYDWGPWLKKLDGTWAHGYITGSSQPMKFIEADGKIIDYYQQLTELVDEQMFPVDPGYADENLDTAGATVVSQQRIDASENGDYAAIMTQFHVDYVNDTGQWIDNTLAYAQSKNIPMWNADSWLSFTKTRHDANYTANVWNDATRTLTFTMNAVATPGVNLSTMVPLSFKGSPLVSVSIDGTIVPTSTQTINGVSVAFATVPAGTHSFVVVYQPPTPTPTPTPTATATSTPTSTPTATSTKAASGGGGTSGNNATAIALATFNALGTLHPDGLDIFDPGISKVGFLKSGQTGVVGEKIEWVITVSNPSTVTGKNVVMTDTLVNGLHIDNVVTSAGKVKINGQTVTITIPTLLPAQVVQISIFTTSLTGANPTNTACLRADGLSAPKCATGLLVSQLPSTGFASWRLNWVITVIGALGFITLLTVGFWIRRKPRPTHSA